VAVLMASMAVRTGASNVKACSIVPTTAPTEIFTEIPEPVPPAVPQFSVVALCHATVAHVSCFRNTVGVATAVAKFRPVIVTEEVPDAAAFLRIRKDAEGASKEKVYPLVPTSDASVSLVFRPLP
jgi:hypothetical protein